MTAYSLTATHSLTNDRVRVRDVGVIQLRCTLTVYLLTLQPIVDALLRSPLSIRRPRAISIHSIITHHNLYGFGSRTWSFTLRMHTRKKRVRTQTWWGRPLPIAQLEDLPSQLLVRFEQMLNLSWYTSTKSNSALLGQSFGVLKMLP
jgi:hypothetical protein